MTKIDNHQYHLLEQDIGDIAWGKSDSDWSPPNTFPDLTKATRIAVDLETKDPNLIKLGPGWCRNDGHIIGIAVAAGEFHGYYPIRHAAGNMDKRIVFNWLKKQMATPDIPKVFHNAMYDLLFLSQQQFV